mgnify:CR=1 FL=1
MPQKNIITGERVRSLRSGPFSGKCVLYWMIRDKRIKDNWALVLSQNIALKNKVPLIVCYQYVGDYPKANIRQYGFLFKGLKELEYDLSDLNIRFVLLKGHANKEIPNLILEESVGTMITDFSPLKIYKNRLRKVLDKIKVPCFQVDTHNIIPCWDCSDKKEYSAYTIRKKIEKKLTHYLTDIPSISSHPYGQIGPVKNNWAKIINSLNIDTSVREVEWLLPGEKAANKNLSFIKNNLKGYGINRNNPNKDALSNMSPYFHFGHISAQRVALEIKNSDLDSKDKKSFLEEMIVRRELSDNFCEYEKNYDYFEGFHAWAQNTLNEHRKDKRDYLYHSSQFELAETHDPLWNAAQRQMVKTGKMHGYMRMYWAKKILEWSPSPEIALQNAIDLNDKYELDGRDPNGYAGIAWSIGGIHDRAWFERPVYGKIRYMNYNGCKNKFNVKEYIHTFTD